LEAASNEVQAVGKSTTLSHDKLTASRYGTTAGETPTPLGEPGLPLVVLFLESAAVGSVVVVDVIPLVVELDIAALAGKRVLDGDIAGQGDDGVAEGNLCPAA